MSALFKTQGRIYRKSQIYKHQEGRFVPMEPNERGRFTLPLMGNVELGLWQGSFKGQVRTWPRWWDADGSLLLTGEERAAEEKKRAERLAARLRALGQDPDKE